MSLTVVFIAGVYLNLDALICADWQFATDGNGTRRLFLFVTMQDRRGFRFLADEGGKELEALLKERAVNTKEN